jgi:peptidoglycan/xylan/chitin deacetylase (PgdA/CDA1 family)
MRLYLTLLILLAFVSQPSGFAQEIAITFDDAPTHSSPVMTGEERTSRILAQLKAHQVAQVAFFVTTIHLDQDPTGLARLKAYAGAGHLLANHSHTHQWIRSIGTYGYIKDIQRADSVLKTLPTYTPWFRYPFLDEGRTRSSRDPIRTALADLKLSNGYVTIDNYDWYLNQLFREAVRANKKVDQQKLKALYLEHVWNSIQFFDAIAKRILGRSPKHVLLLHENDLAAYFIGDLIQLLKDKKWKIISPAEAYRDPIAASVPDVLFNGQGRVAAIAFDQGVPARELVQESEDEAYLDKLVASQQVFK